MIDLAFKDRIRVSAMVGGAGCGKTFTAATQILLASQYFKCSGMILAPTHKQLHDATLEQAKEVWNKEGVPFKITSSGHGHHLYILGRKHILRSTDNPETIRGPNVGWAIMDEAAYSPKVAIDIVQGRVRDSNGPLTISMYTTPKGQGEFYQYMYSDVMRDPSLREYRRMIYGIPTKKNKYLPKEFIDSIYANYTGKYKQQELDGMFVVMAGTVYQANFTDMGYIMGFPLDLTIDFGRNNPYVGFIMHYGNKRILVKEICKTNLTIHRLIVEIKRVLRDELYYIYDPLTITCDPAGDSKNSQTYLTDYQIIKEAFPDSDVRYTRNKLLTSIENGIMNVQRMFNNEIFYIYEGLNVIPPDSYTCATHVCNNYKYPTNKYKPDMVMGNIPLKDNIHDHPADGWRYYFQNTAPIYSDYGNKQNGGN